MKKNIKILLGSLGIGFGSAAVGGGIATGIILPKALAAKAGLEKFIPSGGESNSLAGKSKINLVAIGDSVSAGYNGVLGRDYRGYADFLAKSFQNANKLGEYNNFSTSGERLADIKKDLFERPGAVRKLSKADLITITIGANDVLAFLKLFHIPFVQFSKYSSASATAIAVEQAKAKFKASNPTGTFQRPAALGSEIAAETPFSAFTDETTVKSLLDSDKFRKLTNGIGSWKMHRANSLAGNAASEREKIFKQSTNENFSKEDSERLFTETVKDIYSMIKGSSDNYIHIDKDWTNKIFDLVKREMATLVRDLHAAAPKAKILVMGHNLPFEQFPSTVLEHKRADLGGLSVKDTFDKLLRSMKEGAFTTTGKENKYVDFLKADELKPVKDANPEKQVLFKDKSTFRKSWKNTIMPNILDIHPSVFGYDKIGQGLFEKYGKELGLTDAEIKSSTQHSTPASSNDEWSRKDELDTNIDKLYATSNGFKALLGVGSNPILHASKLLDEPVDQIYSMFNKVGDGSKRTQLENQIYKKDIWFDKVQMLSPQIINIIKKYKTIPELAPIKKIIAELDHFKDSLLDSRIIWNKYISKLNDRQAHEYAIYSTQKIFANLTKFLMSSQSIQKLMPVIQKLAKKQTP